MHILKLTNGLCLLIHNLLFVPDTFKTPSEVLTAGKLVERLNCPAVTSKEAENPVWSATKMPDLELSEKQRDLLKEAVNKHVSKLPPNAHTVSLLTQLGFEV
jgi:hypothetical protein